VSAKFQQPIATSDKPNVEHDRSVLHGIVYDTRARSAQINNVRRRGFLFYTTAQDLRLLSIIRGSIDRVS